jgi:hypothetical protein
MSKEKLNGSSLTYVEYCYDMHVIRSESLIKMKVRTVCHLDCMDSTHVLHNVLLL